MGHKKPVIPLPRSLIAYYNINSAHMTEPFCTLMPHRVENSPDNIQIERNQGVREVGKMLIIYYHVVVIVKVYDTT